MGQKPGQVVTIQYRSRHKDGSWRWLESTLTNLLAEPSVGAIVFNFRDITERKQAEESLQKSEKRFRALVEHSLEEVSLVDSDGTLTYESPTTRRPLGYPPNSFVGHNLFDLFHPDERAAAARLLEQSVKHPGSVHEALFRLQHQDGSWRWMEGVLSNLLDEPAVQSIVINYRDITERKQAETALQESEYIFRSFLEQSEDAIMLTDNQGVLIQWSKGAEKLTGFSREESLGQPIWDIQFRSAPDEFKSTVNYEHIKAALQSALLTGKGALLSNLLEAEIQRPDGTRLTTQTLAFSVHTDKGFLLGNILRDITQRKQAKEEIKISNAELSMLFELSHSLAEADNLEDIFQLVNRHAVESIHTTFARIALLEDEKYTIRAAYPIRVLDHDLGVGDRNPAASLPYAQRVLEQKEPLNLTRQRPGDQQRRKKSSPFGFCPIFVPDTPPDQRFLSNGSKINGLAHVGRSA